MRVGCTRLGWPAVGHEGRDQSAGGFLVGRKKMSSGQTSMRAGRVEHRTPDVAYAGEANEGSQGAGRPHLTRRLACKARRVAISGRPTQRDVTSEAPRSRSRRGDGALGEHTGFGEPPEIDGVALPQRVEHGSE